MDECRRAHTRMKNSPQTGVILVLRTVGRTTARSQVAQDRTAKIPCRRDTHRTLRPKQIPKKYKHMYGHVCVAVFYRRMRMAVGYGTNVLLRTTVGAIAVRAIAAAKISGLSAARAAATALVALVRGMDMCMDLCIGMGHGHAYELVDRHAQSCGE